MAAPRQSFYHNSAWHTIEEPYIYDGGEWKSVHNIWLRDAGAWKNSHKTPHGRYDGFGGAIVRWNVGDVDGYGFTPTYTVPAGVHYLDVQILGQSGGAGGNIKTSGDSSSGRHYSCSWTGTQYNSGSANGYVTYGNTNWITNEAKGGSGGSGGLWQGIIEVNPGEQFQGQWDKLTTPTGGQGSDPFYLPYDHRYNAGDAGTISAGEYEQSNTGEAGGEINFRTYPDSSNMRIRVSPGLGGVGGKCTVSAVCKNNWFEGLGYYLHGYTVTNTVGANGADGVVASQGGDNPGAPPDHLAGTGRFAEITHGVGVGNSNTNYFYNTPSNGWGTGYSGGDGYGGQIQIAELNH